MQSNKTCKGRGYLLEDLAGLAGCDYLSDLRCAPSFRYPIFVALSLLFAEDYSVKEWTDAVKYIVDETAGFSSAKEAYAFLRKSLAEKIEPVSPCGMLISVQSTWCSPFPRKEQILSLD